MGHQVTILTGLPNHPLGRAFGGYRRRLYQTEWMGNVRVVRVASWIAPNTGAINRLKSQLSLMVGQMFGTYITYPEDDSISSFVFNGVNTRMFPYFGYRIIKCLEPVIPYFAIIKIFLMSRPQSVAFLVQLLQGQPASFKSFPNR